MNKHKYNAFIVTLSISYNVIMLYTVSYDGPSVKEKIFKYFFHHRIFGGENKFKYIFSPKNTVVKIYLNIFSPPKIRW